MRLTTARGEIVHGGKVYALKAPTSAAMAEAFRLADGDTKLLMLGRAVAQTMPTVPTQDDPGWAEANCAWVEAYVGLSDNRTRAIDHLAEYGNRVRWLTLAATVISVDGDDGPDEPKARAEWLQRSSNPGLSTAVEAWLGNADEGKG